MTKKRRRAAAIAVAAAVAPAAASAATITVNSLLDNVPPLNDGLCTLREATINANQNSAAFPDCAAGSDPDTIDFTVSGTITLDGGFSLEVSAPVLIDGPAAPLTIDANGQSRIFTVGETSPSPIDVTIQDLTLINGDASLESTGSGGAIFAAENLTLRNVTITGNSAITGGGVAFDDIKARRDRVLTIIDSTISDNLASCCGGGVAVAHASSSISGSNISNNAGTYGGGIGLYRTDVTTITDTTITGNLAYAGGGLYLYSVSRGAVQIEDSTITGNSAYLTGGGASLEGFYNSALTIRSTSISNNDAPYSGGLIVSTARNVTLDTVTIADNIADVGPAGVHLDLIGDATIVDSQITGNDGGDVGGVLAYRVVPLDIVNSTIARNTSGNQAGGILADFSVLDIDLTTIAANAATNEGGNLWVLTGSVDLESSIVADGIAALGPDIHMASPSATVTADWTLIETPVTGSGTFTGTNITAADPLLGPLANNGGPTLTMKPHSGSLAINGGDPAFAPPPSTDQRKLPRPVGRVDMGAVEIQSGTVSMVVPASIAENSGTPLLVTLNRTGGTEGEIRIDYTTVGGTATSNVDFTATSNFVIFAEGETQKTFTVGIIDDLNPEPSEQFTVQISSPASAVVTILDNDNSADLAMVKAVTAGALFPGGNVLFTIAITNNGPANAPNVVVTDPIPAGTTFISANPSQGTCSGTATVTCTLSTLNSGTTATIALTLRVDRAGDFTNTATGASDLSDPTPASASVTFNVVVPGDGPALSGWMLLALAASLASLAMVKLR